MDFTNRSDYARRLTDEEIEEWNRDPISFIRGLVITAGLAVLFWAAVVFLWIIY